MMKERRIEFTGTGFQALGWSLYYLLLSIFIIPTAWGAVALYRWLIRNLKLSDGTKASFSGLVEQVWGYFVLSMLLGFVPLLSRTVENTTTAAYVSYGLSILTLPISALIGLKIMRWFIGNIKFNDGTVTRFVGEYVPYLGWLIFISLSALTIIGWAWVAVAFLRWLFRNVEAGTNKVEFLGSGWGLLWRCILAGLASIFIIPIPWVYLWVFKWIIGNIVITQEITIDTKEEAINKVFFIFTSEDIDRAIVVRKCWESEENKPFGLFNRIEFDDLQKQGDSAIREWIDEQLIGTSVTVVLVGKETCSAQWVNYGIQKSIEKGIGLLGIDISKIKDSQGNKSERCGKIPIGYPFYLWNKDEGKANINEWIKNA